MIIIGILIFYWAYQDSKKEVWSTLLEFYPKNKDLIDAKDNTLVQMVFFKKESDKDYDYFNVMHVYEDEKYLVIENSAFTFFVNPILIPKSELQFQQKKVLFLKQRRVFKVANTDVLIGI